MTVAMLIDNPQGSREMYEKVSAEVDLAGPLGGRVHLAGPSPQGGWRVIDVFDSVEEATSFLQDRFAPALRAAGYTGDPPKPEFWPVDNLVT